jgi:hypothetical protein
MLMSKTKEKPVSKTVPAPEKFWCLHNKSPCSYDYCDKHNKCLFNGNELVPISAKPVGSSGTTTTGVNWETSSASSHYTSWKECHKGLYPIGQIGSARIWAGKESQVTWRVPGQSYDFALIVCLIRGGWSKVSRT